MSENVKIELSKKQKKIIIAVAAIVVFIGVLLTVILTNKNAIYVRAIYEFMPPSVIGEVNGEEIEFFVEKNENFNSKKDISDPLTAFSYYYYDADGNRVDLGPDGTVEDDGEDVPVSMAFFPYVIENANKFVSHIKIAAVIIVLIIIAVLIVFWFFRWSKKQDEEKEKKYSHNNKKKKKN